MNQNDFYVNYMSRTYNQFVNSQASKASKKNDSFLKYVQAGKEPGTAKEAAGEACGTAKEAEGKVLGTAKETEREESETAKEASVDGRDYVTDTGEIHSFSTADMTMEEYKQYIYNKICQLPFHPSQMNNSVWVSISDEGYLAMQQDPDYEKWVLDTLRKDFAAYDPWTQMNGGRFTVHRFGASRKEYRTDSWYMGYMNGRRSSLAENKKEEGFWVKRAKRQKQYFKMQEKIAQEKQILKRVFQEAALRRGDIEDFYKAEGLAQSISLSNILLTPKEPGSKT